MIYFEQLVAGPSKALDITHVTRITRVSYTYRLIHPGEGAGIREKREANTKKIITNSEDLFTGITPPQKK